jgi:hypothetical protein
MITMPTVDGSTVPGSAATPTGSWAASGLTIGRVLDDYLAQLEIAYYWWSSEPPADGPCVHGTAND